MSSKKPLEKTRFKMYKAGKTWLVAGIAFLAFAGFGGIAVHADAGQATATSNVTTTQAQTSNSNDSNLAGSQTTNDEKSTTTSVVDANATKSDNSVTTTDIAKSANTDNGVVKDDQSKDVPATSDNNDQNKDDSVTTPDSKDATASNSDVKANDDSSKGQDATTTATNVSTNDANTTANDNKTVILSAGNQPDGWNTDHTQYTQGGQLLTGVHNIDGTYYDFDENHNIIKNNYVQSQWGLWYMFGDDGRISTDVTAWSGTYYYFDHSTYLRVDNDYVQSRWGDWYMFGNDGRVASGVTAWNGTYYYFDPITHLRVDNNYVQSQWGLWYMFGNDGRIVTGLVDWYGSKYYFDENTYTKVTNDWRDTYLGHAHFNSDGVLDAVSDAQKAQQLENIADQFLGWGYVWGGNNPSTGFDCSGLTQYIMSQIGISIARTASDQYANSRHISAGQAQKGDLVYFCEGGSVIHAGLYIGNGLMIDAQVAGVGIGVHRVSQLSSYYPAVYGRYLNL